MSGMKNDCIKNGSGEGELHIGHRERMKARFKENMSFQGFAEHEILEMLLFYCYPRGDTNKQAHKLIERFGSVEGVLSATLEELVSGDLIGENPALNLKIIYAAGRWLNTRRSEKNIDCRNIPEMKAYVASKFCGLSVEKIILFFVTPSLAVKNAAVLDSGEISSVKVDLKLITKTILNSGYENIIIAHNHPGASSRPSDEDVIVTRKLIRHLSEMEITLLDHYISGNDGVTSMRQQGLIYDYEP